MDNSGSPDEKKPTPAGGQGTPPVHPNSAEKPTGSLSRLVPGQNPTGNTNKISIGSTKPTDPGPAQPKSAADLNQELQAGLQAHQAHRAQRAGNTGEYSRPTTSASSADSKEYERLIRNVKTGQVLKQQVNTDVGETIRKKKSFETWQTFAIAMIGLTMLVGCGYAARQISIQTEAKRSYIVGRNLLRDGKYDLAAQNLTRCIRNMPDNADAYFYRGMAYAHTGQYETAMTDFDKVLTFTPERVAALSGKSLSNLKLKDFDKAIVCAGIALKYSPTDSNALLLRSIAYSRRGSLKEALADCDTLIEAKPRTGLAQAYANRAFIYFKMGQVLAAIRDYRAAIKEAPKNAALYSNLAQCLKRSGDVTGAIAECKACLKLDSKDLPSLLLLGECLKQNNEPKEALKYLERAVSIVACAETLRARADAYMANGNFKLAYIDLDRVLTAHPKDADAIKKRRICHAAVLKAEGALAAQKLEKGEELVAATEPPQSKLKLATTFPELLRQGYALLQAGSSSQAVEALMQAVRLNPRHPLARRYLAYAMQQSGDSSNAAQQFHLLAQVARLDKHDMLLYGKALAGANNNQDAAKVFRQLVTLDPGSVEARAGLIQAYIQMNQSQAAIDIANQGIQLSRSESEKETYRSLITAAKRAAGRDD